MLSRETRNLVTALRRPDVRGRWGEMTLKRLVELSGMSAHADFTEQHHQLTESGAIRPDMIVHMPERRDIVVDVKTPLDAYLAAVEAQTEDDRGRELKRHAQVVSARVRELASKQYWAQFEHSPDFVVLFLPGDQFLSAALQENPDLIDESLRQNVMLATPTSLVALLKTVALGWKQAALAENAAEIRKLGEDMYKRLGVFGDHLAKLGKSLGASVDSFNKAVGSLEQQVMPAARRFPGLGLRVNRELELIEPVETLTRVPRVTGPNDRAPRCRLIRGNLRSPTASARCRRARRDTAAGCSPRPSMRDPLLGIYALLAEWRALDRIPPSSRRGAPEARLVARGDRAPRPRSARASDRPLSRIAPARGARSISRPREDPRGDRTADRRRPARARRRARGARAALWAEPLAMAARLAGVRARRDRAAGRASRRVGAGRGRLSRTMRSRAIGVRRAPAASSFRSMNCSRRTSRMRI